MAVIQDVVYNHFGPADNPLPRFGPYVHHERTTGWGASVNLQCDEVTLHHRQRGDVAA